MTNTITLKKSSVAAKIPLSSDLNYGELAINYTDGNLFFKDSSNNVQTIASTQFLSVTGNVIGGNIVTTGIVSAATANVTGNVLVGNIFTDGYYYANGAPFSGGGGGGDTYTVSVIGANTSATVGVLYVLTNSLTLTLPGSPAIGSFIAVSNRSNQTDCIIARNGRKIMGTNQDLTINVVNAAFELVYVDTNQGWILL